ncbi:putative uncharacterized protein [Waddlia chondrophila 2032/99]|uniref:SWIM-type domain-containing protein n=1 Tax=Waddlia chondrophila 2032/99 TaxID=765953 RepID=F8LEW6_9BACT|nr:putative uncharacterized protein [Waddlia chondrophila 2032/99]
MKINKKILSLPPYISTSWTNVESLHMEHTSLIISLYNGESVSIPDVDPQLLESIFDAHASFIESGGDQPPKQPQTATFQFPFAQGGLQIGEFPFKFGAGGFENFQAAMQHNPEQANMDNLPEEILSKIRSLSKILIPKEALESAPKGEPHCNCMYCQVAKALHEGWDGQNAWDNEEDKKEERVIDVSQEEVRDSDLQFQQWQIIQTDEKMYTVTNKLDTEEKYNVFLGHPLGCTCGKEGCEHILAVLKS